jgi:hypothetical protein
MRVYMFLVQLPSLVRIEPELHHNDSPTYTTLPCQVRAWERQSNTRIACLASVRHTGQVCPTTRAEQSAHTHRCPHGTSASNLPTSSALRHMQHSASASASNKGLTARSVPPAAADPAGPLKCSRIHRRTFARVIALSTPASLSACSVKNSKSASSTCSLCMTSSRALTSSDFITTCNHRGTAMCWRAPAAICKASSCSLWCCPSRALQCLHACLSYPDRDHACFVRAQRQHPPS